MGNHYGHSQSFYVFKNSFTRVKKMENPQNPPPKDVPKQFKSMMIQGLQSSKINPMIFVQLEDLAKKAITQKEFYPILLKEAADNKIIREGSFGQEVNYKMISLFVTMGKIAKEYMGQNQGSSV